MTRVFLSSVTGLADARTAACEAIDALDGFHRVGMETFGAIHSSPIDACFDRLRSCEIYVGIVGHLYGSSPPGEVQSYTELEFHEAGQLGLPRFIFLAVEDYLIPASLIEDDGRRERQRRFRETVSRALTCASFASHSDLRAKVGEALANYSNKATPTGPSLTDPVQTRAADLKSLALSTPTSEVHDGTVFHCVPQFDGPAALRSTGIAELLPDLILRFRGDPGERRFADLWVYANTNITSRIVGSGGLSEATLSVATGQRITELPTLRHNMHARQTRVNAIGFLNVPLHELSSLPLVERNLRLSNLRVNAGQLGLSVTKPSEVYLFLMVSDTTVAGPNTLAVGRVTGVFRLHIAPGDPVDLAQLPQAQSMNAGMLGGQRVAECLTLLITCTGQLAGYEPSGERTRILLKFTNVPEGVALFVTTEQVTSEPARLLATLTESDQFGNGPLQEPKIDGHVAVNGRTLGLSRIDLDSGAGHAALELDGGLLEDTQTVTLGVVLAYRSNLSQNVPERGMAWVRVTLAPAGGPLAGNETADAHAPIPRFHDPYVVQQLFSIVR